MSIGRKLGKPVVDSVGHFHSLTDFLFGLIEAVGETLF